MKDTLCRSNYWYYMANKVCTTVASAKAAYKKKFTSVQAQNETSTSNQPTKTCRYRYIRTTAEDDTVKSVPFHSNSLLLKMDLRYY